MILFSLLFSQSLAMASVNCTMEHVLQNPHGEAACVQQFLKEIRDDQDRAEFKYRLNQWRPRRDLKIFSEHGVIEAVSHDKTVFRAIWLKMSNPAILWLDGKILTDKTNNPSMARTIDNLFKSQRNASVMFLPEAHADDGKNLAKDALFFYSLGPGMTGQANEVVAASDPASGPGKNLMEFLPSGNMVSRLLGARNTVKCTSNNLVQTASFTYGPGYGQDPTFKITPKSPTQFIVQGIETNKTQLVTVSAWPVQVTYARAIDTIHPQGSALKATIADCEDKECRQVSREMPLAERNLMFRHSPEKEAEAAKSRLKSNQALYKDLSKEMRYKMVGQMFGLSIMGACCSDSLCQQQLKEKYSVNLQPAASGAESSAVH